MTREELLDRLQKYEWSDIECKLARRGVSQDTYATVSAFANTAGGLLVFGVRDTGGSLQVVGVDDVNKVQNDFLSTLRAGKKLNRVITVVEDAIQVDGRTLLTFHVPESPRHHKPIYLGGDIRQSFIRRGAGDERCTMVEIERFLRDATTDFDSQLLNLDADRFFEPDSLRWYRRLFDERNPGRRQSQSDIEFLHEWGFVRERDGGGPLAPTRAAVLVLGRPRYVLQVLPRPVVDYQFIDSTFDAWPPDLRWSDRVVVEENLVTAWLTLSERFVQRAERPFRIDPSTLRRDDDPPDYVSFREAAINLLLHQDYGDQNRHPSIRLFRDRMEFRNPGEAFATTDQLLEPRAKDVRNPEIVAAFRRLGLSEQAGTGIRAVFRSWQALGHVPPVIDNNKATKTFEVRFLREALLTEAQQRFQSRLGLRLQDAEARVFAFACREGRVSLVDAKAVAMLTGPRAADTLEALQVQGVLRTLKEGLYGLAEHLQGRVDLPRLGQSPSDQVAHRHEDLVTAQADMSTAHVTSGPANMSTAHGHDQVRIGADPPAHSDQAATKSPDLGSDQVRRRHDDLGSDQVDKPTAHVVTARGHLNIEGRAKALVIPPLSSIQWRIVTLCDVPRLLAELMDEFGVVNRGYFKKRHLDPLIQDGLIAMTNPAKPRAPGQRYILTEAGVELRAYHMGAER